MGQIIKTQAKSDLVAEACREFKDLPSLTLARLLYKRHRHLFPNLAAARCGADRHCRKPAGCAVGTACAAKGASAIQMVHLSTSPPQAALLYERIGFRHTESSYTKLVI